MATEIVRTAVSAGATAVRLDTEGATYWDGTITNRGTADVRIGDSAVTASAGYRLSAGESLQIRAAGVRGWYAIATTGTQVLDRIAEAG